MGCRRPFATSRTHSREKNIIIQDARQGESAWTLSFLDDEFFFRLFRFLLAPLRVAGRACLPTGMCVCFACLRAALS